MSEQALVLHKGSCHCGSVQWQVEAPADLTVFDCNCSICHKKQNIQFIVPAHRFQLLQGEENLTTYTFNKGIGQHRFCKACGVQSFYVPRSNPDGFGIAFHCIDSDTVGEVTVKKIDGRNWKTAIGESEEIKMLSK